ncbi:MAG: spinster family MFS transporter [Ktedonobacterales bacterium]
MSEAALPHTGTPRRPDSGAVRRAGRYARYVFWLMFAINFLNYLDRWIFTGLSPIIQQDLRLSDFQIGMLTSGFLVVYTIVALPLGFLADRIARKTIVGAGVAIWSVATALTGLAGGFGSLLGIRALLGVGEGSYYPAGTPMLAAYFPPSSRAKVLSRWSTAALIGAAVGFLIASPFSSSGAWRYAFFFTGIPGLIFAFLIGTAREKTRHEDDPIAEQLGGAGLSAWQRVRGYLRIPTFRVILGTHLFGFFALTGVTSFLSIYLTHTYVNSVIKYDSFGHSIGTTAGPYPQGWLGPKLVPILAGALVLIGGILGNLYGGIIADRLSARNSGARVFTGGLGFLLAAPCVAIAVGAPYVLRAIPTYLSAAQSTQVTLGVAVFAVFALLAAFFLNLYNGPMSAALLDVVPAAERGAAGGTELTLAHLLGDVYAAVLIGALATAFNENIGLALLITCPAVLVVSGIIGIRGSRHYAADVAALGASAAAMLGTVPVQNEHSV